jgi:hypothetical protein
MNEALCSWQVAARELKLGVMLLPNMPPDDPGVRKPVGDLPSDEDIGDEPLDLPVADSELSLSEEVGLGEEDEDVDEEDDVGLDAETGPEETFGDSISTEEDAASWIGEAGGSADLALDESPESEDKEEDGWVEGGEPDPSDDLNEPLSIEDAAEMPVEGGDEGFEGELEQQLDPLPPLDDGPLVDESEDLDELAEIPGLPAELPGSARARAGGDRA